MNESPFNSASAVSGTFSFSSSRPVSVVALRGLTNERSEFLITTLPVVGSSAITETVIVPHFADGGGWSTQLVLVNPTDQALSGFVEFFGQESASTPGQPVTLTMDGQTSRRFTWSIAPRSSKRLRTSDSSSATQVGWVLVTPATSSRAPSAEAIFSYRNRGVTVAEAGIAAMSVASAFRMYAEASGDFVNGQSGSIRTGIAVANPSQNPVTLSFEVTGQPGIGRRTATLVLPPQGHAAMFLNQIPGFESMPSPLQGLLRISAGAASISVIGLRGRYNERGDFLITTVTPVNEGTAPPLEQFLFPHFVYGGGYTTQFVLHSGFTGQVSSGSLQFLSQSGQILP